MDVEFSWSEEYPSSSVTKHVCTVDYLKTPTSLLGLFLLPAI